MAAQSPDDVIEIKFKDNKNPKWRQNPIWLLKQKKNVMLSVGQFSMNFKNLSFD